jgi:Flavin containing amine oxidoreductase
VQGISDRRPCWRVRPPRREPGRELGIAGVQEYVAYKRIAFDTSQGFHVWGRQEGRIHFAGDSTSRLAGWMQGGIESGQRVACEVAAAL